MVSRSHLLASAALLSLSATVASAETIVINSGFLLMTGPSEIGAVSISGTRGFSLSGPVDTSEGGTLAFSECTSFECQPGHFVDLRASFGDLAFGGNRLTFDGQEFTLSGELTGNIGLPLFFSGSTTLPPLGTMPPIVRAPFALDGTLAFLPFGPIHELTGRGTVEVSLIEGFEPQTATRGWTIDAIRWNFEETEPVPEPGTMLLVATGTAVLARLRKRSRHPKLRSSAVGP
jgi:hypothetical protein